MLSAVTERMREQADDADPGALADTMQPQLVDMLDAALDEPPEPWDAPPPLTIRKPTLPEGCQSVRPDRTAAGHEQGRNIQHRITAFSGQEPSICDTAEPITQFCLLELLHRPGA